MSSIRRGFASLIILAFLVVGLFQILIFFNIEGAGKTLLSKIELTLLSFALAILILLSARKR